VQFFIGPARKSLSFRLHGRLKSAPIASAREFVIVFSKAESSKRKVRDSHGAHVEGLETRRLLSAASYYVSPLGNDTNSGTSESSPWKTIARADTGTFGPGVSLLLLGGSSYSGDLTLTAADAGTSASPMTVGSYGTGVATIAGGKTDAITVTDAGGINILNLDLVGSGPTVNKGSGIDLMNNKGSGNRIGNITINNVAVSGFGFVGIGIGSTSVSTGFSNVSITNSRVDDNAYAGIFSYAGAYTTNPAPYGFAHSNIYISNVSAYDNTGYAGNNDSGDGIELGNVNGATVEHCTAYSNGADNSSTGGGPVGIWAYNANAVVIEYNQSYANEAAHQDGDGFDLDGGTTNSIIQYNFSHDNDGAGILEAQFAGAHPSTGNIIRFNVCQNDGRRQTQGGITLWSASSSDTINGTQIYNNTLYLTKPSVGFASALFIESATDNVAVRNNIFDVSGGMDTVLVKSAGSGLVLQDNDYWTGQSTSTQIGWGSSVYETVAAFRSATKQELLGSTATGFAVNPGISKGATVSGPAPTSTSDFVLLPTSPLIDQGLDLSAMGVNPGSSDYYGDLLTANARLTVGAYQPSPELSVSQQTLSLSGSAATSFYLSANGTTLNIWQNAPAPGSGAPTQSVGIAGLTSVQITAGSGSRLTLDLSDGDSLGSLPIAFNSSSAGRLSLIGTDTTDSMQVAGNSLTVDGTPISYSGVSSIAINAAAGQATLTQTQQPTATVNFNGSGADLLVVQSGVFTFSGAIGAANLTVDDEASVVFTASTGAGITTRQLAMLNISSGAKAEVAPAVIHTNRLLIELGKLVIAGTGQLDLQNNDMLIHNGNINQVTALVAQGRNGGSGLWRGDGIDSSAVAAGTTGLLALGAILNKSAGGTPLYGSGTALGLFDGVNASATDVLVKYTYAGDANLNGRVDGSDFSQIDNGNIARLTGWTSGDFNYSGTVDGGDYALIDDAMANQAASL
jgi:hypothetical protein